MSAILLTIVVAILAAALLLAALSGAVVWWDNHTRTRRGAKVAGEAMARGFREGVDSGRAAAEVSRRYAREVHGAHLPED